MVKAGDRVELASRKIGQEPRNGEIVRVSGLLLTIRWASGEESTLIPGPGSLRVVEGGSGRKKTAPAKRTAAKRPAPAKRSAPAKKSPVARKAAPAKKVSKAQKPATVKKVAPAKKATKPGKATAAKKATKKATKKRR